MKFTINKSQVTAILATIIIAIVAACSSQNKAVNNTNKLAALSTLEAGFLTPPDSIQTSVYWYWMSDNISKEGVVKDLKAMKSVGINRAFIGNIGYKETPYGKVKMFSEEWWDILHTALKTATELDIEIGIFNSPGWSQSGGPWIKPEQSMRYLASSETKITGPKKVNLKLEQPITPFQDVKVIAFRAPKDYQHNLAEYSPKITSSVTVANLFKIMDKDKSTSVNLPINKPFVIDFTTDKDFTARSITIHPAKSRINANAELYIEENGNYRLIKKFDVDRRNTNLNVGFKPYAPITVSFPVTISKKYRLIFNQSTPKLPLDIAEIEISASPKVESFSEKTLAKMYHSPLPYWNEYQWNPQPEVADQSLLIAPNDVRDISQYMDANGNLNWDVPVGDWIVMRTGMTTTGVTNAPASPEATGLEVDKMSKEHVKSHFDAFLGEIIRRIPAQDRKTWKVTVEDSYETGGQNWTDNMLDKFKQSYGYDALPYLPVLQGKVVGSPEISDRFLWDLRRLIADRVAYDYVGGLRDVSHKNGLTTWLENYGHWGFPGEFLQYGGQSDEIAGEFWSEGELGNIENRAASSAAHIYGKSKVSAESFTAGGKGYARYPEVMKQRGDRFFTEGINNTLLHVYIQQPTDDIVPGINAGFGNEFNRHNTWFSYLDLFIHYLKRSNYLLQQGKYVADVAYFIGEDAPKMTGVTDPELPKGYSFDYINAEVIKRIAKVENGRIYLADGMNYGILVLPKLETMRPELLQKITELVAQGATILGPAPKRSPSLEGYPAADQKVKQLAAALWGNINGTTIKSNKFGKGLVLSNMDMQTALNTINILADFKVKENDPVLFIHRTTNEGEFYFISNQSDKTINISPEFRVRGKQPEFWDPTTGKTRLLTEYTQYGAVTKVPLNLESLQSAFIVFRKSAGAGTSMLNFPEPKLVQTLNTPWEVTFDPKMRGPEKPVIFSQLLDWTKRPEESIKYYSGTAVYRNTFKASKPKNNEQLYLNLGDVKVMAKVKINGVDVGGVWTSPWKVNITNYIKSGTNKAEVYVVNTWVNRLIGDSKLPVAQRKTWTSVNIYKPDSPLEPSGLKGPVTLTLLPY